MQILKTNWLRATATLFAFFIIGSASLANATEKNDIDKKSKTEKTEKVVMTKWFHFIGDASNPADLANQSKYTPVPPENELPCESETDLYRCAIYIDTDPSNSNLPDLSKPVQAETKRNTANPSTP